MTRSRAHVRLLAAIIALALIGLAGVQFILLRKNLASEADAFQRNAVVALSRASDALSAYEIMRVVVEGTVDSLGDSSLPSIEIERIIDDLRTQYRAGPASLIWVNNDSSGWCDSLLGADTSSVHMLHIEVQSESIDTTGDGAATASGSDTTDHRHRVLKRRRPDSASVFAQNYTTRQIITLPDVSGANRSVLITAALSQLEQQEALPIEDRIDRATLDSSIAAALASEGINLDYTYGIIDLQSGQPVIMDSAADSAAIVSSSYRTRLFAHDILSRPYDLAVTFPAKQAFLLKQMLPVAVPAGLFLLTIAVSFVYSVRVMINQQGFAARLSDFINNMTHEFKTPISTIQLASEAIQRREVQSDPPRLEQFNNMIRDENRRMKAQVDKILQMAVLEDGGDEIKREPTNFHDLVAEAVEMIRLNIDSRQGRLECSLKAEPHIVEGDAVHLRNVVANLLDNACKYSPDSPQIRVSTESHGDMIRLRVSDRGIGVDEADRPHVFDRYFRVATGDRHDVKGFGLGLAYVRLVVQALGGQVNLNSALGKGTEVVIDLPTCPGDGTEHDRI